MLSFKYLILILFISLGLCSIITATPSSNLVDLNNPDTKRLEYITFEYVNQLRINNELPELVWDNVLYRAAIDQANYLVGINKLKHSQPNQVKKTTIKRVKLHGGIDYTIVGENLMEITLGAQYNSKGEIRNTVTYESAAKTLKALWEINYKYYRNIVSQKFLYSAIATAYDSINQRLIAVQIFGYSELPATIEKLPDLSQYLLTLEKPKLPYGLKEKKYDMHNINAIRNFYNIKLSEGYVQGSYKQAKKIFKGRRSGICQELIPIEQYDSASADFSMIANRRNGLYELNGTITKPVYRRQLLKYSRKNAKRDYLIDTKYLKIKKRPTRFLYPLVRSTSNTDYNLFLIKNKRLQVYTSFVSVPGMFFSVPFPDLKLKTDFVEFDTLQMFRTKVIMDTMDIRLYYAVNETSIDSSLISDLQNELNSIPGKIIDIRTTAYASIEGNTAKNEKLAKERLNNFIEIVNPYLVNDEVKPALKKQENWDLFRDQIKHTKLQKLSKLSKEEARSYINKNIGDTTIQRILDEQRYVQFNLIWKIDLKEHMYDNRTPADVYRDLIYLIEDSERRPRPSLIKATEQAQLAYYNDLVITSIAHTEPIIDIPDFENNLAFKYHDILFKYLYKNNISDEELFSAFGAFGYSRFFPSRHRKKLTYNNLVLLYQNFTNGNLNHLVEGINCYQQRQVDFYFRKMMKIKCKKIDKSDRQIMLEEMPRLIAFDKRVNKGIYANDLSRYYYLNLINELYYKSIKGSPSVRYKMYALLPGFKRSFHPIIDSLSEMERLQLAYFYSLMRKPKTAKELIEPVVNNDDVSKELLKLYFTLKYDEFEIDHDYANYLIDQYARLGKDEWCDIWFNPDYLSIQLLEDLKLKNFYNCNCGR